MEENLKHIELIEAYHEGKLSPEEKVEFEVRLLVDQELQKENDLYKKILYGFHDIKADKIHSNLKLIDQELDSNQKIKSEKRWKWWGLSVAASIAVLFAFYFLLQDEKVPLPVEEGLPVLMGEKSSGIQLENAMQLYKSGDYQSSYIAFKALLKELPENDTVLYFCGCSALYNGNFSEAIPFYKKNSLNTQSVFNKKASYFLAYSLYQTSQIEDAKAELLKLSNSGANPFKPESEKFLQIINERKK